MSIFARYQDRFEAAQEEEMSVQEYLELCKRDPTAYASVAERMLLAIANTESYGGGLRIAAECEAISGARLASKSCRRLAAAASRSSARWRCWWLAT